MKHWARYRMADQRICFGLLHGDDILEYCGDMFGDKQPSGIAVRKADCTLLSPCVPSKILGLWNNSRALGAKIGKAAPIHPLYFIKAPSALSGPGDTIKRPRSYEGKILFEGELGVVIGRVCKDVTPDQASGYIFGYTCVNDVTAAEILPESADFEQWARAKSFDTFCCLGPVIASEFDPSQASIVTRMNDVERQNYPASDLIFSATQIVSRISQDMSLLPGDVIACGTSLGVGSMKTGARVEVSIAGIGTLANVMA